MLVPLLFLSLAAAPEAAAISDAQLDQIAQQTRASDAKVRHDAAARIAALPPEAFMTLVKRLEKPKQTTPDNFRKLFLEMWEQVPNWRSGDPMWIRKPEPAWTPPPR